MNLSARAQAQRAARSPRKGEQGTRPRDRILATATELFYRHGIQSVSVDQIAETAGTNKMTLYRHFESKDVLIAECLRIIADAFDSDWDEIASNYRDDPEGQLRAWLAFTVEFLVKEADRGCALGNAAIQLADRHHPAWVVIEEAMNAQRSKLVALCRQTGYSDPDALGDELILLLEGARVNIRIFGSNSPAVRLDALIRTIVDRHSRAPRARAGGRGRTDPRGRGA